VSPSSAHNLPPALSRFIGRESARAELAALLRDARLVTLTGPGGAGKTRLAREAAWAAAETGAYPDGVWWVELAPLDVGGDVAPAVAAVLGVRPTPGRPLDDVLADALRARSPLLVLDNCEHVVESAAALVDVLLRAAPGVRVLATSREALAVEGETAQAIPGLDHPAPARDGAAPPPTAAAVGGFEAVRLFVDRVQAMVPGFALTDGTAPAVAQVCARLDGQPLALELAAAALPVLGLDVLAARLDDALAVLTRSRRTAVARHRTLRALIDWSYAQLAPAERTLLARLSVFRNPVGLDGVEAVGADADGADAADVTPALVRLVEQSLVTLREEQGEARYALLETVRQYAAERLGEIPGAPAAVRARHAAWVAAWAERDEPETLGPGRGAIVARQLCAADDARAALEWATGPGGDARLALRIVGALTMFWNGGGAWREGRRWVDAALAAAGASDGADDAGRPLAERVALARTLHAGLSIDWLVGEGALAASRAERALALWHAIEADPAADAATRRDATRWRAMTLERAALTAAVYRRDLAAMERLMADALDAARAAGAPWVEGWVQVRRAGARLLGDSTAAVTAAADEAEHRLAALGDRWARSIACEVRAEAARREGRLAAAAADVRAAIALLRREPDFWFVSRQIEGLGTVAATEAPGAPLTPARAAVAAELLGAAEGLRLATGTVLNPLDRPKQEAAIARVRGVLSDAEFAARWEAGRRLPPDATFALASDAAVLPAGFEDARPAPVAAPAAAAVATRTRGLHLRVLVCGPLTVEVDGEPVPAHAWEIAKARELLLYLVLHPPQAKERIALALWPEASEAQVRNHFHMTLFYLRRALGSKAWVRFGGHAYALARPDAPAADGRSLDCDVDAVRGAATAAVAAAGRGERPDDATLAAWRAALDRADRGSLGEGLAAGEWIVAHRRRLAAQWADGIAALAELHAARDEPDEAIALLEALLRREPLRESAHRALVLLRGHPRASRPAPRPTTVP
jgi:predicted ATPase/DNA-binding SARP family transcriptional activator